MQEVALKEVWMEVAPTSVAVTGLEAKELLWGRSKTRRVDLRTWCAGGEISKAEEEGEEKEVVEQVRLTTKNLGGNQLLAPKDLAVSIGEEDEEFI